MTETITAADASEHFLRRLREVEAGKEFVVTRDGVPVARILAEAPPAAEFLPNAKGELTEAKSGALARTMARLANPSWGPIERIGREELHAEDRDWTARLK